MMPTSISQIIEQVFNAAVSLLAAWGFINAFSDGTENSIAKWGAAGSTVGTGAGVVTALAFMLLVYGVNRRKILQRDFSCDYPGCFADHSQRLCL